MKGKEKAALLCKLFLSTLYISAFTFGGGFVIVTFMKRKFVDQYHWIDEDEMLDITALAQSSPGAIAVNAAILVGWKVAGFFGMVVSVLGTVLPPMVILSVISLIYQKFAQNTYVKFVLAGMQAGVAAVILDVVCSLGGKVLSEKQWVYYAVMILAFIATFSSTLTSFTSFSRPPQSALCRRWLQSAGGAGNDLFRAFLELFASRAFQHRGRLRRNSFNSKPGCGKPRVDYLRGIHQFDYHFRNDTGADCR